MKEILDILRQEIILCTRLQEVGQQQQQMLAGRPDGDAADRSARQMDPLLRQLGSLEQRKAELLESQGMATMQELLLRQPFSAEKTLAGQLLAKLAARVNELQRLRLSSQALLTRNMQYIDFNINVMTQATAGPTYAPPGGADTAASAKKMFDQSV